MFSGLFLSFQPSKELFRNMQKSVITITAITLFLLINIKHYEDERKAANLLLPLTIAFALGTDVISQHGTQDEILFRRKLAQRFGDYHADSIQTFFLTKEEIQTVVANRLDDIINVLTL